MVNALVQIDYDTNKVLNIVKARYGLKNKGEAIQFVVGEFVEYENEPDLRPEFIERMKLISEQKSIRVDNFARRYGLD
ncbi:MAG: antitoxin [Candidatus Altiarchaeota archaeon]